MGKTLVEAWAEVKKCAGLASWFAERGPALLADERAPVDGQDLYVSYLPIGVVLGIMPWNFPLWQALRAAVPITPGGSAFLLKPAPNTLGCGYAIAQAFERSGAPPGLLSVLDVGNDSVDALLHDPRIAAVTLTGSVGASATDASIASKLIKKSLLELGGSDAFIVLADADLDAAVTAGIKARFQNAGQVCLAAERFTLEAPIGEAFTTKFVEAASRLVVGDPLDKTTDLEPIAREGLHKQVEATTAQGTALLLGGCKCDGNGFFYGPTVFGQVKPGMAAFDEETFAPVAALTVAADVDETITLANSSDFGLSGNLWTRNIGRARALARRLETGGVFINGYTAWTRARRTAWQSSSTPGVLDGAITIHATSWEASHVC